MISAATTMALVRGLHLAATLSLLGTAGFLAWILPAGGVTPDTLHRRLVRLWWISGSVALLAGLAWFTLQSAAIAGADNVSDLLAALPVVAEHTRYGTTLMLRLALLLVATLAGCRKASCARRGPSHPIRNGGGAPAGRRLPHAPPRRRRPRPSGRHRPRRRHRRSDRRRPRPLRIPSSPRCRPLAWRPATALDQPAHVAAASRGRCLRAVLADRACLRAGPRRHRVRPGAGADRQSARFVWHRVRSHRSC